MSTATLHLGDVRDVMATMADGSIDLVLTSPPFLALRSYLPDDHPDKHREIGGEPTPAEFLDTLLVLTAEWGRLLTPHGSIAVELGDTYAGSGSPGGDYNEGGMRAGQPRTSYSSSRSAERKPKTMNPRGQNAGAPPDRLRTRRHLAGWPLDKSLSCIPQLYEIALAYGINPLTGEESPAGMWRVRNFVAWCRPNPAIGALGDKYRPATSYMTIATRARDRWFDLEAVRCEPSPNTHARTRKGAGSRPNTLKVSPDTNKDTLAIVETTAGRPPYGHSRDATGIDIDERNEHLVRERVGMFLADVIDHRSSTPDQGAPAA